MLIFCFFQVDYIFKHLEEPLFLVVHNLDGGMLRGDKNQSVLARLASHQKIHLVRTPGLFNHCFGLDKHVTAPIGI
jgi:hypothetical protein